VQPGLLAEIAALEIHNTGTLKALKLVDTSRASKYFLLTMELCLEYRGTN
jgi:hypothetical protein